MKSLLTYPLLLLFFCVFQQVQAQNKYAQYELATLEKEYQKLYEQNDAEGLMLCAEAMLKRGKQAIDLGDSSSAKLLEKIGTACLNVYRLDEAEKYYKQSLLILEKKYPKSLLQIASLNGLGTVYFYKGAYANVEKYWRAALQLSENVLGKNDPSCGELYNALAVLYTEMGEYDKQEEALLHALSIRKQTLGESHRSYIVTINNLGVAYYNLGAYEKAEDFYLQALQLRKTHLGESHPDYSTSLSDLGVLYEEIGQYDKAEQYLQKALELKKQGSGENHPDYANSLNFLGTVYWKKGEVSKAENAYLQALKIRKQIFGNKHPDCAMTMNNLAGIYRKNGNYAKAESYHLEVLEIDRASLGENHPSYINSLLNLGSLYTELKDAPKAWDYFQKAIAINSKMPMQFPIDAAWSSQIAKANLLSPSKMVLSLEMLYDALGKLKPDDYKAQQSMVSDLALLILQQIKNDFSGEESKLRILSQSSDWVMRKLSAADPNKDFNKVFEIAEQNKAVLLLDAARAEKAYSFGDLPDSLVQQEKKLQTQKGQLKAQLLEARQEQEQAEIRQQLNQLNLEIDRFNKNIKAAYPKYLDLKYNSKNIAVADIQAKLKEGEAILEFVRGDSMLAIFYLDKKQVSMQLLPLRDKGSMTQHIKRLHQTLSNYEVQKDPENAKKDYIENARWLYKELLEPTLAKAKGIKHLIIIPDGDLSHLPFETFLYEDCKNSSDYKDLPYLLKKYSISYNYSATLWQENRNGKKSKNNGKMFAIAADYAGKADSIRAGLRLPTYVRMRQVLQALPEARKEVEMLSESFVGFFGFDKNATERVFKAQAQDYGVIHLAMHGLLDSKHPILSSLAFTEDGDSLENNFLQAHEISKMKLQADLVVLSACETGYGKFEKGNGTASLARAFMYAGVPAMVVSLWQVNDASTSQIMQLFYKNLSKGMDKAEALRQAKLEYINAAVGSTHALTLQQHPAFWAPFILIGDERPINLASKGGTHWWWYLIGGVSLLSLSFGFFAFRKKREK